MKRPHSFRPGLLILASILAGCDYSSRKPPALPREIVSGPLPSAPGQAQRPEQAVVSADSEAPSDAIDPEIVRRREVILGNVIKLMQTASTNPGGQNFAIATDNLNELFEQGTRPSDYFLSPAAQDFLLPRIYELTKQDPEPVVKSFCSPKFTIRDARHIEDCMLYHVVANRVAGEGDDLTRVRRIFDWTARNILLVPPESLAGEGLRQAPARPADVLLRGMATEYGGLWSERGWLFMSLCRQIGVDVGILTFSPRQSAMAKPAAQANRPQVPWVCAAIVEGKPYLFDHRVGLEVPSPDGTGVATLEEAIDDPSILGRLDLPGLSPYSTSSADLAGSTTKIGMILDSSTGYFSPRMRLLQGQLRGQYRTILFRDPAEMAGNIARALGKRLGPLRLWDMPIHVEESLFNDSAFVQATLLTLRFFDGKYPLLYARTAQLRGETAEAIDKYVTLRFAEDAVMRDRNKTPISKDEQKALDFYATYFLAQCHLDQGNTKQAEDLYRQLLALSPEPGPGRYYYYMLRWGALTNLGRISEARGDRAPAIAYYSQDVKTPQRHGNLIRARNLVWGHPFDEPAPPLPPAPKDIPLSIKAAAR